MQHHVPFVSTERTKPFGREGCFRCYAADFLEALVLSEERVKPILVGKQCNDNAKQDGNDYRHYVGPAIGPRCEGKNLASQKQHRSLDDQDDGLDNPREDQRLDDSLERALPWVCGQAIEDPGRQESWQQGVNHLHDFRAG
jgi:hypothetical protein